MDYDVFMSPNENYLAYQVDNGFDENGSFKGNQITILDLSSGEELDIRRFVDYYRPIFSFSEDCNSLFIIRTENKIKQILNKWDFKNKEVFSLFTTFSDLDEKKKLLAYEHLSYVIIYCEACPAPELY